jgi:hypothetical protein
MMPKQESFLARGGSTTKYTRRKVMTATEELKDKFSKLTEEEKVAFMKSIMPSFCDIFRKNPKKMMAEMMPFCRDMMQSCNMDMQGMMKMMGKMGGAKDTGMC